MARILFFSDTHLGFDWPSRPRVERRRQGDDFYANASRVVTRALQADVDLVVHGGDVFHRSRPPLWVAERAYALLRRVADHGIPVVAVPGNHERATLPFPLLFRHPKIHVFDRPRTYEIETASGRVALSGFPYLRAARRAFAAAVAQTELSHSTAETRLLCVHQCFEGARVGPHDWVFRDADDVVRGTDIPSGVAAVLSGHIHRHQALTRDLRQRPLAAPVLYPGSVERTSSAERGERKGFLLIDLEGGRLVSWQFVELPARPLAVRTLIAGGSAAPLEAQLARAVGEAPPDAVLVLRVEGRLSAAERSLLGADALRRRAPASMNVRLSLRAPAQSGGANPV